jgi:hypothetical protein
LKLTAPKSHFDADSQEALQSENTMAIIVELVVHSGVVLNLGTGALNWETQSSAVSALMDF